MDGLDAQSMWLLFMDLIAGKVAVVSPAEQVGAVVLQSRGTCKTGSSHRLLVWSPGFQRGKISPIVINRGCLVGAGVWA